MGKNHHVPALIALRRTAERVERPRHSPLAETAIRRSAFQAVAIFARDVIDHADRRLMLRADARTYSPGDRVLLQMERSTVSTSASHSISGSFFPRFSALRKIPSQALALKKYFSGALSSKICDKVDSLATLGNSSVLGVQHAPGNRITFSHDATGVSPNRFSCLTPPPRFRYISSVATGGFDERTEDGEEVPSLIT